MVLICTYNITLQFHMAYVYENVLSRKKFKIKKKSYGVRLAHIQQT
jgi:hypothetical protein